MANAEHGTRMDSWHGDVEEMRRKKESGTATEAELRAAKRKALFGGMKAQIVTAVRDRSGEIVLLLSVHDLVAPRTWSDIERRWCRHAADRIWELVGG